MTLLLLGLTNSGKTSVFQRMNGRNDYHGMLMAIFQLINFLCFVLLCFVLDNAQNVMYFDEFTLVEMVMENFQVTILKPSSQETTIWSEYYAISHSVVFVVDSADLSRMKETKKTLKKVISHPFISGKPILMWAMLRNGTCVEIQSIRLGKKKICNCMFSGSPINRIRRKH